MLMNWDIIVGVAIAIAGWWIVHRLEVARSRAAKRQEMRTQYLLEAYRRLAAVGRRPGGAKASLEGALEDIQLLGTPKQIELVQEFAERMRVTGVGDVNELLQDLRRSLRHELDLESSSDRVENFIVGDLGPPRVSR